MPSLDHTGPKGEGPKTGRKLGLCRKSAEEQKQLELQGKGRKRRFHNEEGNGRRRRNKLQ